MLYAYDLYQQNVQYCYKFNEKLSIMCNKSNKRYFFMPSFTPDTDVFINDVPILTKTSLIFKTYINDSMMLNHV